MREVVEAPSVREGSAHSVGVLIDAMGVLYEAEDDVAELLIPFVRGRSDGVSPEVIGRLYRSASVGRLTAEEFWRQCGLERERDEAAYLELHQLCGGVRECLGMPILRNAKVACVSNDISEWSRVLRRRFNLDDLIPHWIVSGDWGVRKPSKRLYEIAMTAINVPPSRTIVLDDRPANLDAAESLGCRTYQVSRSPSGRHRYSRTLAEALAGVTGGGSGWREWPCGEAGGASV